MTFNVFLGNKRNKCNKILQWTYLKYLVHMKMPVTFLSTACNKSIISALKHWPYPTDKAIC